MEPRDLQATAQASSAVREGVPAAEEDGLLSAAAAAMAREAALHFQSRRFAESAEVLKELLEKKGADPKVLHNIAVSEYFLDGCSDPKNLLEVLGNVQKSCEELANTSIDQVESTNGQNGAAGSRGSSIQLQQFSAANVGTTAYGYLYDSTIIIFNKAVILYHLHEYPSALSVLQPLYQNIEPIDETTALHVCFLLLDITLALEDAPKAADIVHYLEKSYGVSSTTSQNDGISLTMQQQQQQQPPSNQLKPPAKSCTAVDVVNSDANAFVAGSENPAAGETSDDVDYENLFTLDGGNQNLGRPHLNDRPWASADLAAAAADLKVRLQIYKVRLLLLTRNLKVAKRELKVLMNMARGRDSSTELLLKSQLEYARGNHRKAVKLLSTPNTRTDPTMLAMFYNNIGCVLHQQHSHQTSLWFFSKALRISTAIHAEKPMKLDAFSRNKSNLILYNCGVQHLMCGKPLLAASCFQKAMPDFRNRAIFWLRFSECCLLALEKGLISSADSAHHGEVDVIVVGSKRWRQLLINPMNSRSRLPNGGLSSETHGLVSLKFARQCLQNALLLLDAPDLAATVENLSTDAPEIDGDSSDQPKDAFSKKTVQRRIPVADGKSSGVTANGDIKGVSVSSATLQSSIVSFDEICKKENLKIKQAVLADLAFVELSLDNPLRALSAAKSLQQLPDCSKLYAFLSRVYAAEALCLLNRLKEAAEFLSVYVIDGNMIELPYSIENNERGNEERDSDGEDSVNSTVTRLASEDLTRQLPVLEEQQRHPESLRPEESRGLLYVNLALIHAVQGDLDRASSFVSQGLIHLPSNPMALLAAVYIDLLQGKAQDALPKLRQARHVRFRGPTASH